MRERTRDHTMGSGGECICPKFGETIDHRRGMPGRDERCPECGAKMLRVGSHHHDLWLKKKSS